MTTTNNNINNILHDLPYEVVLMVVAGSVGFGLNHENSDTDLHGVYVAPITEVLGLHSAHVVSGSYVRTSPDITLHEIGKFITLGLKCNPTILETLWLEPLQGTATGRNLISYREKFLSEKYVRNAYKGYAYSCLSRDNRFQTAKAARHAIRILDNGYELLTTATMRVNRSFEREELFALGELAITDIDAFSQIFAQRLHKLETVDSCLPESPDTEFFEYYLPRARLDIAGL